MGGVFGPPDRACPTNPFSEKSFRYTCPPTRRGYRKAGVLLGPNYRGAGQIDVGGGSKILDTQRESQTFSNAYPGREKHYRFGGTESIRRLSYSGLKYRKAHNLREKALEVIRMYRELALFTQDPEQSFSLEFEEPGFITLGLCYEERPRFSGGAYHPVLKRTDQFLKIPLPKALDTRAEIAEKVLDLDDVVVAQVEALKERGLTNPYLKNFLVARINPLRFRSKEAEPLSLDQALDRMQSGARKFNPDKIKMEDIARSGGGNTGEET